MRPQLAVCPRSLGTLIAMSLAVSPAKAAAETQDQPDPSASGGSPASTQPDPAAPAPPPDPPPAPPGDTGQAESEPAASEPAEAQPPSSSPPQSEAAAPEPAEAQPPSSSPPQSEAAAPEPAPAPAPAVAPAAPDPAASAGTAPALAAPPAPRRRTRRELRDAQIPATVEQRRVAHGRSFVVAGRLPSGREGVPLVLQFRPRGGSWRAVVTGMSGPAGVYRLVVPATRSGIVRVVVGGGGAARGNGTASAPHGVLVDAVLRTRGVPAVVLGGRPATVAGMLLGAGAGSRVVLERWSPAGWRPVVRSRTRRGGAFRLRFLPRGFSSAQLRVRFAGTADLGGAQAAVGRVAVLRSALASWYGPGFYGRPVACGGTPLGVDQIGVAHRTLPCGTRLTLRYRGHTVQASVIDRGPFVGAREFDLTQATKNLLRFRGVGVIQVALA